MKDYKNICVKTYVDKKTYEQMKLCAEKEEQSKMSDFLRDCIHIKLTGTSIATEKEIFMLRREINRIGVNINQITRKINKYKHTDEADLKEVEENIRQIRHIIEEFASSNRN